MAFNSAAFVLFFSVFFVLFHFALRKNEHKLVLITVGSLLFYASFDWRFVPILLTSGIADFFIAAAIGRSTDQAKRRRLLIVSIVMNLAFLGFFKYVNFFIDNGVSLLGLVGVKLSRPALNVILPVGISFYTFQSISYITDIYRGQFTPRKRLHEFIASLTFFPHLLAGPIVRSANLLPQFTNIQTPTRAQMQDGFILIAFGLTKKTIADMLSFVVDPVFSSADPLSGLEAWTGAVGFLGQVYGDFSGYTDIAIGVSLLLGFQLPVNFNLPYLARSPADFWKRWHISLSSWLHDYLYVPLATRFRGHPYVAIFITWLLAGLWHGPSWIYVAFGAYYALLLISHHWLSRRAPEWLHTRMEGRSGHILSIAVTFYLVSVGEVIFRSTNWKICLAVLRGMHAPTLPSHFGREGLTTLGLVLFALVFCHVIDYLRIHRRPLFSSPWVLWPTVATCFAFTLSVGPPGVMFIYFAF